MTTPLAPRDALFISRLDTDERLHTCPACVLITRIEAGA